MNEKFTDQDTSALSLKVVPARPEHWRDVEAFFARIPCWCQAYRTTADSPRRARKRDLEEMTALRRAAMQEQLEGPAPPGVLAYLDDQLVGWCGLGPRAEIGRLARSRTIPVVDDLPVWSIFCFLVRTGYRRRGVARALLQGAIECARSYGAPAIEAYPVDPEGKRISTSFAYVGTISMFEAAGFRRVLVTDARSAGLPRWLVRLDLAD
jgi:GNAT superfamily N-acetyltransferase